MTESSGVNTRAAAPPGGSVDCARAKQPGSSLYCAFQEALCTCACQVKPAAAHRRPRALQLLQEALCTAPATQKPAAAQRRPRAPQLLQEALCTAPATRKAARKLSVLRLPREASCGPAAPTRAAAPSGGSVYCACHAKGRQEALCCACHVKPAAAQRRPRAPQLLQEALCTAPATRKAARKLSAAPAT